MLVEENGIRSLDGEAITNVLVTLSTFLVFALVMPRLGFVISSILLIGFMSTFFGNRHMIAGAAVSIGVPLGFYNILRIWLQVVLPQNPFFPNILWF